MSIRPSTTQRGSAWLANFAETERATAQLLIDSLQVCGPTEIYQGLKYRIEELAGKLRDGSGLLIPALSIEDINESLAREDPSPKPHTMVAPVRHVAYQTFRPGSSFSVTPGSEAAAGNLIRDFTGSRPGREHGQWLHPATDVDRLRDKRCRLIVLIADYSGSGNQVIKFAATLNRNARIRSWRSFGWVKIVVVLFAASSKARAAIESKDGIDDVVVHIPAMSFDDALWSDQERIEIEDLCRRYTPNSYKRQALGYGNNPGLFFTSTSVPNNLPYILRRPSHGWNSFLEGRTVSWDLAEQLDGYRRPVRDIAAVVRSANQARIGRAIDAGRLWMPADKLVAILALLAHQPRTPAMLTHKLSVPHAEISTMLGFLEGVGFITTELTVTERGREELHHARRLDRIATAHLTGRDDLYYPQSLR